jgi:hypothetical protein
VAAVDFDDLLTAFEFVGSAAPGENNAYISLDTGEIHWTSELCALDEEVPEDLDTSDRYVLLPHKTELELGKPLALRFAASESPECYERVAGFFRRKGAYAQFKAFLASEEALERWYSYEAAATERALREWCMEHGIPLVGRGADSGARRDDPS